MSSLFASMNFVILLDYSVVHVGVRVVDNQPAVMIYSEKRTASMNHHSPVIPHSGSC